MNLHIITGASKGLGAALAQYLANQNDEVVNISRSKGVMHNRIKHFSFDLNSFDSHEALLKKIFTEYSIDQFNRITLINNASIIDPITSIKNLDQTAISKNFTVNLMAPVALTATFLKFTENFKGTRLITNISSGVASRPIASWACYSAAKAGLYSFTQSLAKEFANNPRIKIMNFSPGIIDTGMQARIREITEMDFPEVGIFKSYKIDNKLKSAEDVGTALGAFIIQNNFDNFIDLNINDLK